MIKQIKWAIGFMLLLAVASYSQVGVMTVDRSVVCGNEVRTSNCSDISKNERIIFQEGKTFFIHDIGTMQSVYSYTHDDITLIDRNQDDEPDMFIYRTTSEAGNHYVWIFDLTNRVATTIGANIYITKNISF